MAGQAGWKTRRTHPRRRTRTGREATSTTREAQPGPPSRESSARSTNRLTPARTSAATVWRSETARRKLVRRADTNRRREWHRSDRADRRQAQQGKPGSGAGETAPLAAPVQPASRECRSLARNVWRRVESRWL